MGIWELFFIAVGLSMDAFAVSVCTGMTMKRVGLYQALVVGLYFGLFQALMPLLGYLAGVRFSDAVTQFDHWIAFGLLGFIGGKMVWGSLSKSAEKPETDKDGEAAMTEKLPGPKTMLPLALATSIDALAVGVSFAFLQVRLVPAVSCIGAITLVLSMAGVKLGKAFGDKLKTKAELLGGIILIGMGVKILIEHLQ